MIFIFSMLLTSFIGFCICYKSRTDLILTERMFISILIGWGYFTSLVTLFSINLPEVELRGIVLFTLIIISLLVFCIPAVILDRRTIIHFFKSLPTLMYELKKKRSPMTFCELQLNRDIL